MSKWRERRLSAHANARTVDASQFEARMKEEPRLNALIREYLAKVKVKC